MEKTSLDEILVHDETNLDLSLIISNWTSNPDLPEPIGVIYSIDKPTYNQDMLDQIENAKEKKRPWEGSRFVERWRYLESKLKDEHQN